MGRAWHQYNCFGCVLHSSRIEPGTVYNRYSWIIPVGSTSSNEGINRWNVCITLWSRAACLRRVFFFGPKVRYDLFYVTMDLWSANCLCSIKIDRVEFGLTCNTFNVGYNDIIITFQVLVVETPEQPSGDDRILYTPWPSQEAYNPDYRGKYYFGLFQVCFEKDVSIGGYNCYFCKYEQV